MKLRLLTKTTLPALMLLYTTSFYATPGWEVVRVLMFYSIDCDDLYIVENGSEPIRSPHRPTCPVEVFFEEQANTFYLTGQTDCTLSYTIYDSTGAPLQSGDVLVCDGEASIPLAGERLTNRCSIELTFGENTFTGVVML